jgi:hypothetical protein
MTLIVHAGAEHVDYDGLHTLDMPEPTDTHVPIAHHAVVDMVKYALGFYGHDLLEEHHAVTPDGMRYFGVLSLKSSYGNYTDMVGLRNSHDKRFPIGIAIGSQVFVCDNLAFHSDHVIRRKHTVNAKRDLPGLVAGVIEPLGEQRKLQHRKFERYRGAILADKDADHAIMQMYRTGVVNVTRIAAVLQEWDEPSFDEFRAEPRTVWRLFNATTFALTGRVTENPAATQQLHTILEGTCCVAAE